MKVLARLPSPAGRRPDGARPILAATAVAAWRWRAGLPLVAGLLLGQALAIQVLFYTRW